MPVMSRARSTSTRCAARSDRPSAPRKSETFDCYRLSSVLNSARFTCQSVLPFRYVDRHAADYERLVIQGLHTLIMWIIVGIFVVVFGIISHLTGHPCLVKPGFLEGMNLISLLLVQAARSASLVCSVDLAGQEASMPPYSASCFASKVAIGS